MHTEHTEAKDKIRIVVSMGDPNGVGLECFANAIKEIRPGQDLKFTISGNRNTVSEYFENAEIAFEVSDKEIILHDHKINFVESHKYVPVEFGQLTKQAGELSASAIETALQLTMKKVFDAILTLPVNKHALYMAGWKFPGHTEMLAHHCSVKPMMILMHEKVRVCLATVHVPVIDVSRLIEQEHLLEHLKSFNSWLKQDMGVGSPKIAVLGLNPHAGENGNIGKEEENVIKPLMNRLDKYNINAEGPFPADGFFAHGEHKEFDGILAMYHDQGLIPLKLLAGGAGVNVTAGLPIVRTSPDHGTAFPIAGKGMADQSSTLSAIRTAIEIVRNRRLNK